MTRTFVLTHGAWHGAWCWQRVAPALRAAGHAVVLPTLTGLGHRAHLSHPMVGLDTHVRDVTAVLEYEDLQDVVLVGHSYAGMVAVGAAAAAADRVGTLVVVDGFLPERGERAVDLLPPHAAAHYRESAEEQGAGWRVPPRPLQNLGVTDDAAAAWLRPRLVDHPFKTYTDAADFGASELTVAGHYLACDGWNTPFGWAAERAAGLGWQVESLDADHEIMATSPDLLVDALLRIAADDRATTG